MREADRAVRLRAIVDESERLHAELAEEAYLSGAGLRRDSDVTAIYARYTSLIAPDTIALVQDALTEAETSNAPADERRALRSLLEFLTTELVHGEVREITDQLRTREKAARLRVSKEVEVLFHRSQAEMASSGDREQRLRIEERHQEVVDSLTPLCAERIGIEQGIARALGQPGYLSLFEQRSGIALDPLDLMMRGFLARTSDMYRDAMAWTAKKHLGLPLADVRRSDLLALFRLARYDDSFPKRDMLDTTERSLREMGIDLRCGGRVTFDLEARPGKSPRAFCAAIDVPDRIVVCVEPQGGRRDWQHFLHELGRALPRAHTSRELPFATRCLGDASLDETYAFLLQYLLLDRGWLKRHAGMSRSRDYVFLAYLEKLLYLRRYAAKLSFAIELYRNDGVEGMDERYADLLEGALFLRYPSGLYLYDLEPDFHVARYLRAWLFEALLRKHLVHYFDEDWYRNPRAGEFLKKRWATGNRLSADESARELGYDELSTRELEQQFEKNL